VDVRKDFTCVPGNLVSLRCGYSFFISIKLVTSWEIFSSYFSIKG
jgi:hypothetical protein